MVHLIYPVYTVPTPCNLDLGQRYMWTVALCDPTVRLSPALSKSLSPTPTFPCSCLVLILLTQLLKLHHNVEYLLHILELNVRTLEYIIIVLHMKYT